MAYQAQYGEYDGFVDAPAERSGANLASGAQQLLSDLDKAKAYLPGRVDFDDLRQQLEGPKPLRVLAGLGGLALAFTSALGLINIFALLSHPAQFVLQIYETLFGLLIAVVELKSIFKPGNKIRDLCYKWFKFLTHLLGKGLFCIFAGSLGLGFGFTNLLVFIPACFVMGIGVVYALFAFGQCNSLREKYEQTMVVPPGGAAAHYMPDGSTPQYQGGMDYP